MAQTYTTGPVYVLIQRHGADAKFLGTSERFPRVSVRPGWEPVFNDIGGQRVPIEILYEGAEAFVSVDLTRWNENIFSTIVRRGAGNAISAGTDLHGDVGAAMLLENLAYRLILVFPYAPKPAYANAANGAMPAGLRFHKAIMVGPDGYESMGTAPRKIRCVWHCLRDFTPATGAFDLYDYTIPNFQVN